MARFLRTETNSSGGHSRLRPPAVVVTIPPVVYLPVGINGSLAPIDSNRRVRARSFLRPPAVVGVTVTAVYSGPAVTLALSRRGKPKSRLLPVPAAFRPVGKLAVHLAPSFSLQGGSRTAKSRLTQVVYEGTSGPPIRGYLTPPLDRVPISNSILRPPAVVAQAVVAVYSGPTVTLAPSRRPVAKSRLLPVPSAFQPVGQLDVHLAPSRRGVPKSRLEPPTVVGPVLARKIQVTLAPQRRGVPKSRLLPVPAAFRPVGELKVTLAYSLRGKAKSRLEPPTVVAPVLARPTAVHLTYSKRGVPKSKLSPPTVVTEVQELLPRPHDGTLAPLSDWRRVYTRSFLRPPVRQTDLAVPSTVTLFPLLGRVPAVHSRLRPPVAPAQPPAPPIVVTLAPSRRPIAKSRLLPVPSAFRPVGELKVALTTFSYQSRVKAKPFLRPPVRPTDLAVPASVTLFPITNRVPAVHSRLQPPATLQVAQAVYYGPAVTLAYSLRGKPKSRLAPPAVVAPVLARAILVHLAPSSRGKAKPHLSPPAVVAPVLARRIDITLAPQRRGTPKSRLSPPTVVTYFQARPTLVVLAPSSRGVPKSRLEPPTVVGPVLARPIKVTLAPQRRGVPKSKLRPPTDLVDQADVGTLRVHLTYSRRGAPKSILRPPVPPETFRGLAVHLAPSSRGKTRSFFIPTPIARQAVELSGPKVTLVRIRPPKTMSLLPQASLYQPQPKAEYDLKITLAPQRRGKPKSFLRPPAVVRAATPYFRELPTTFAPQVRGKAKSFLRPPVVVRRFVAAPISITLAPQPKPQTMSRLFGYVVPARVFAPISVTLAPQPKPRTISRLRNYIVAPQFIARPESITLARITPPPVHSRLRPPAVVGAGIYFRGIQVHLAYSVRGKTMSRLSFTELQIVPCYGDAMCGFDFAADVLGSDTAPTVLGTTAASSNVTGTDVAPTVEGASAASGSVSGDDARREGC